MIDGNVIFDTFEIPSLTDDFFDFYIVFNTVFAIPDFNATFIPTSDKF